MERIHIYQVAWDKLLSLDCKEVSWMVNDLMLVHSFPYEL